MSPEDEATHTNDNGINQNFHNGSSQHNNNTSSNNNNFKLPQLSVIKNGTSQPTNGGSEDWKNFKNNYNNNDDEYKLDIKDGSKWSDNIALPTINNNGKLNG